MRNRVSCWLLLAGIAWHSGFSPAGAQDDRGADLLVAEISGLSQAARTVRDPKDRGRLWFLASLKLDRIRTGFPRSPVAAELAFGRYGDIDAGAIDREAKVWLAANGAEAEILRRAGPVAAASGATAAPSTLMPNFGRAAAATAIPSDVLRDVKPEGRSPEGTDGRPLSSTQLAQKLREAAVFIYVPGVANGSGFFISPTHILTNTHVVEGAQRVVVANKTIGVRAARVLALGMSRNIGPDTAVLQIEGTSSATFLPFAATVTEGESIAVAAYPGKAARGIDKAYVNFMELIRQNRIPTADNIPNVKFDFGFIQSLFVENRSGIESAQIGVTVAPGSSGSPVVNRCGEVVAQVEFITSTRLDVKRGAEGYVATGEAMTFNFGIAAKELTKFLASTNARYTAGAAPCGG